MLFADYPGNWYARISGLLCICVVPVSLPTLFFLTLPGIMVFGGKNN